MYTEAVIICCQLMVLAESYKILVYSAAISRSHAMSNAHLADELARNGFDVVVLEDEVMALDDLKTVKVAHKIKVSNSRRYSEMMRMFQNNFFDEVGTYERAKNMIYWQKILAEACNDLLNHTDVLQQLKDEHFDMYIGEQLSSCGTGLAKLLNIKTHVWLSSCALMSHMSNLLAIPMPVSYVPSIEGSDMGDKPSYFQRFNNFIQHLVSLYVYYWGRMEVTKKFRQRFGMEFPDVGDIARDSALILVASDEFVDFPRPITHNTIYIGGFSLGQPKPVDPPFSEWMLQGKRGIVLISFGSVISIDQLPRPFIMNIIRAFAEFPEFHFIVKVDNVTEEYRRMVFGMPHIHLTKWAPQSDLLGMFT
ncbi:hypothetical protein AB6A40_005723 [Gnathostoma spinigerum]|uniref:glucuronosyltransferase n=1 Tax=Gnathostoma spinigerum TaxID=75299 RepID=A0ABD6ELI4_9BILA